MQIEPGTSPKHRYELIKATLLVIVGALIAITIVYGVPYFSPKEVADPIEPVVSVPEVKPTPVVENTPAPTQEPAPKEKVYTQDELNTIFEMDKKKAGTKLFYSSKLGVGFTYAPLDKKDDPSGNLTLNTVKEVENKIYLTDGTEKANSNPSTWGGHSLELFTKTSTDSLDQAITKEFLSGVDPKNCSVVLNGEEYNPAPSTIDVAYFKYLIDPKASKSDIENNGKWGYNLCPKKAQSYIQSTGAEFFIGGKDKSNTTYGFLRLGNGAQRADSGIKGDTEGSWVNTIRFLK